MHKLTYKEFEPADFSNEHLDHNGMAVLNTVIAFLNECRRQYLVSNDKDIWWQMIQILPTSYNQKRTVQLNYEVLANMYYWRKNHKLDEWHEFCHWIEQLPYAEELIIGAKDNA